jgi:acetolactate synthase-1/2/3 large subunit
MLSPEPWSAIWPPLCRSCSPGLPEYTWDLAAVSSHKQKLFQALHPGGGTTFTPADAITELQTTLPPNTILTADVGAHLHLLGQLWRVAEPGRLLMTNGWSSMGFGIPAALGAKLCRPDSPVVGLTGDGGFLMNCGELLTARRRG